MLWGPRFLSLRNHQKRKSPNVLWISQKIHDMAMNRLLEEITFKEHLKKVKTFLLPLIFQSIRKKVYYIYEKQW